MGLSTRIVVNGFQRPTTDDESVVALRAAVVKDQSATDDTPHLDETANDGSASATPTPSEETLT